jgi:hypothetical protein
MAAPIGPGDWVECVDPSPSITGVDHRFVLGGIYCVRDFIDRLRCDCGALHGGFLFFNHPDPPGPGWAWGQCAFRPIPRPKASFLSPREVEVA